MSIESYSEEKLNLFIDKQLDTADMEAVHQAILKDKVLGERVCELQAVRELLKYAYESTPVDNVELAHRGLGADKILWQSMAASVLLIIGVVTGWVSNDYTHANTSKIVTADEVFDYFKLSGVVDRSERRIVLHVTTGDVAALKSALDEVEQLLASYNGANLPVRLDVVTFRDGINLLRLDSSPYVKRIEQLMASNNNVAFYACKRSIEKAEEKWGKDLVLIPKTLTAKTAKELISDRIQKGWIYIKV